MDKFKIIYNLITDIWKALSPYKDKDIYQEDNTTQIMLDLQNVSIKYRDKIGESEGILARKISVLFLNYLFGESLGD